MNTVEIKQSKKAILQIIPFFMIIIFAIANYQVIMDKFGNNKIIKFAFISLIIFMICVMLIYPIIELIKNEPVITISNDSITLKKHKIIIIPRNEILDIKVEYIDEEGDFLKIKTAKKEYKTNISRLDKSPDQIKELFKNYK